MKTEALMFDEWTEAWNDLRHRRRWFFGWWLGGLVAVLLAGMAMAVAVTGEAGEKLASQVAGTGMAVWFAGCFVLAWRAFFDFRCPRCSRPFYVRGVLGNPFSSRCLNCGLSRGAKTDRG